MIKNNKKNVIIISIIGFVLILISIFFILKDNKVIKNIIPQDNKTIIENGEKDDSIKVFLKKIEEDVKKRKETKIFFKTSTGVVK